MAENVVEITIKVNKKTGQAEIEQFGKASKKAFGKVEKSAKKSRSVLTSFTKSIFSLKSAVIAAAGSAGLGMLTRSFVEAANTAEQYQVRLKVLLGSQAEGNRMFQLMADFAAKVPFEYEKIMGAATTLSGVMKGGVDEINKWMPLVGDLAAATGMNIEDVTGQIVRMYSAGAASADMFRERGVLAMLGFTAGVSYTAEQTRTQLLKAWNDVDSQFRGATDELASTWKGLMSILGDAWFAFRNMVMDAGVFDHIKDKLSEILEEIKRLKETGDLEAWAKGVSTTMLGVFKFISNAVNLLIGSYFTLQEISFKAVDWAITAWEAYATALNPELYVQFKEKSDLASDALGYAEEMAKKAAARFNALQIIIGTEVVDAEEKAGDEIENTTKKIVDQTTAIERSKESIEAMNKALDATADAQVAFYNKMIDIGFAVDDKLAQRIEEMDAWEIGQLEEKISKEVDAREKLSKDKEKLLQKEVKASEKASETIEAFWNDMIGNMMSGATDMGSMWEMVLNKMRNYAASVFATMATRGTAALLNMVTGGGAGGGPGGGLNFMSLLGGGGKGLSFLSGIGQSTLGFTPLPAGVQGPPTPITGLSPGLAGLSAAGGGYGVYNAYQSGNVGMGGLSGAAGVAGIGSLGAAGATALGFEAMATAFGALAGPLGLAIGAIIGGAVALIGKKGNEALERRIERSESFFDQLGRGATTQAKTFGELFVGSENLLDPQNIYAAGKYGGLSDPGIMQGLFGLGETGREYKETIQTFGESSLLAISGFNELGTQMELFTGQAQMWSKGGQQVAQQLKAIYEKTKEIQIGAIMKDLETGAGTFINTLSKLDLIDMDEAERTTLKYQKTLEFLTTDTMPALFGELTKARDIFKETADEVDRLARSEEEAAIKTQILRSDMQLTEEQLQGLRIGEINFEMIELYQTLGLVDEQFNLLKTTSGEVNSVWDDLLTTADAMQAGLDSLAQQFEMLAGKSDAMMKAFNALYTISIGLELVAEAGQRLEQVPETLESMMDALDAGDIQAANQELLKLTDTLLFMSGLMETIGAKDAAQVLLRLGEVGTVLFIIVEALQVIKRTVENIAQTDLFGKWLDKWEETFPKLIAFMREFRHEAENLPGTLEDFGLGGGGMTLPEAIAGGKGFEAPDFGPGFGGQIAGIESQADIATQVLKDEIDRLLGPMEFFMDPKGTMAAITRINELIDAWETGAADATAEIQKQWDAAVDNLMKPVEDIIRMEGMSELELELDAINEQTKAWTDALDLLGLSEKEREDRLIRTGLAEDILTEKAEERAAEELKMEEKARQAAIDDFLKPLSEIIDTFGMTNLQASIYGLNQWYIEQKAIADDLRISLDELNTAYAMQAQNILDNFWNPIVEGIKSQLNDLMFGQFNLAPGTDKAVDIQGRYDELKSRLKTAEGENYGDALSEFQAFVNTYLSFMQENLASSAPYLDAYEDVVSTLEAALIKAEEQKLTMFSDYENQDIEKKNAMLLDLGYINTATSNTEAELIENNSVLADMLKGDSYYQEQTLLYNEQFLSMQSQTAHAAKSLDKKADARNITLTNMDNKLNQIVNNTADINVTVNVNQAEPIMSGFIR